MELLNEDCIVEQMKLKILITIVLSSFFVFQLQAQEEYNRKKIRKEAKGFLKDQRFPQAEDVLKKAMSAHDEARKDAEFYNMRLNALHGMATTENRNMYLNSRPDTAKYFTYIYSIYELGYVCDSLDRLPDAKGRIRTSYTGNIMNLLAFYRNNVKSAGKYYYKKTKYDEAYRFFDLYLSTINDTLITSAKNYRQETDTLDIARLAVYSAFNASSFKNVLKYLPYTMTDTTDFVLLCQIGSKAEMELKDTLKAVKYLYEGWKADPSNEYFYMNLIDYHVNRKEYSDAKSIIETQLFSDFQNRRLWYLKGKCEQCLDSLDDALNSYQMAIKIDSVDALSYSSIGSIYVEKARAVYEINDSKPGTRAYTQAKERQNRIYRQAREALENARKHAQDDPDLWKEGLGEVYYKLNLGKELKELESYEKPVVRDVSDKSGVNNNGNRSGTNSGNRATGGNNTNRVGTGAGNATDAVNPANRNNTNGQNERRR